MKFRQLAFLGVGIRENLAAPLDGEAFESLKLA